ncbi:MAG: hypothetical protein RQ751_13375 [Longimicrobiales bacterium]|nr:hypothetical protein [Longimicrobiales bacterium]
MHIRPTPLLLALALAFQPLTAQASRLQTTVGPDVAQAANGEGQAAQEEGTNVLIPVAVGAGLAVGSFATGLWGSDAAVPVAAEIVEAEPVFVPGVPTPTSDPVIGSTQDGSMTEVTVSEPGMLGLLALGLLGLMGVAVYRRRHASA